MTVKLFDSELKVMEVLWRDGDRTAKEIAVILREETGWDTNTTYTVIKKCVAKGAIRRSEPGFQCHALISKTEVQAAETEALIGKLFDGSPDLLFASLLDSRKLSVEQLERLKKLVSAVEREHRP